MVRCDAPFWTIKGGIPERMWVPRDFSFPPVFLSAPFPALFAHSDHLTIIVMGSPSLRGLTPPAYGGLPLSKDWRGAAQHCGVLALTGDGRGGVLFSFNAVTLGCAPRLRQGPLAHPWNRHQPFRRLGHGATDNWCLRRHQMICGTLCHRRQVWLYIL